jgi:hypothetical protein
MWLQLGQWLRRLPAATLGRIKGERAMMNYMKGINGVSFDQIITEVQHDGEFFTAHVTVTFGSYLAGRDKFMGSAASRDQFRAIGAALEDVSRQIQTVTR